MKYERLTEKAIGYFGYDLKDFEYKPKEFNDCDAFYAYKTAVGRLGELEDKIESGEIDYAADSKTEQTITDLLIEFDEMGFAPTTVCPNLEQYATEWRERVRKEFARLTAENAELRATLSKMETVEKELRARLEKAVELPCIEPMTTWDWDENTGCGKAHFGKFWKVLYRDNDGEFIAYMGATKEEATAMLAELKGERK